METPAVLREVVEKLAAMERGPGSAGEAEAAEWLCERLRAAGAEAEVEPAEYHDGYAKPIAVLSAAAATGGLLGLFPRTRLLGGGAAAAAGALIADDVANAKRYFRRLSKPKPTQNVVAYAGDPDAERTLVVLAHHDAAPTGAIFDQRLQTWIGERFPGLLERVDTSVPLWWLVLAGPLAAAVGSFSGRRRLTFTGIAGAALTTAVMADIARSPTVPGANDNATACAVLVALAQRLTDEPLTGLRVMLVSCGAEEVIQGGIYSLLERHGPALQRDRTWFLGLETLGSPNLALLEGEGPVVMEDYCDARFRDLVYHTAQEAGAPIRRGLRARNSTDAAIPSHMGYPTATLVSLNRHKALSNYHLMSDTADNIDYLTVTQALLVTEALARALATPNLTFR